MQLYRLIRRRVLEVVRDVKRSGHDSVRIVGDGDIADICRLTCIEQGLTITDSLDTPWLELNDLQVILHPGGVPKRNVDISEGLES
jgi:hypothetical protein